MNWIRGIKKKIEAWMKDSSGLLAVFLSMILYLFSPYYLLVISQSILLIIFEIAALSTLYLLDSTSAMSLGFLLLAIGPFIFRPVKTLAKDLTEAGRKEEELEVRLN